MKVKNALTAQQNSIKNNNATKIADPTSLSKVTVVHKVGKYEVRVIRDKCIGAASCVAIAPQTFDLDEENIAIIINQHGDDDDTRLLAAQSCPTAAIEVIDTQTGKMVWPR